MHRVAILGTGLLSMIGFANAASAADLPLKAIAAAPVPFTWTGCHVGGHIGGVVSQDTTTNLVGNSADFNATGFVAGGQIGCDYQFAGGWVAGVEGRAAWSSLNYSRTSTVRNVVTGVVLPSQFSMSNDFLASATARLGKTFADRWLVFVRGGAAWTREKLDESFTTAPGIAVDPNATMTRTGWTVGAGVDWAFAPHWSASLEYNYYDFGSSGGIVLANNNPPPVVTVSFANLRDTVHTVTVGVDYHF